MRFLCIVFGLLPFAQAITDEFPGFRHFQNWDGGYISLPPQPDTITPLFSSNIKVPVAKDLCAAVGPCLSFGVKPNEGCNFRANSGNGTYDTYLGLNNTGAICAVRSYPGHARLLVLVAPRFGL
jgi:hypothetical protein